MDTKRVESLVIGTGITGSILSRCFNANVIDKAARAGGRCSSGRIGNEKTYDKGATFLKKEINFILDGKEKLFSLKKFFNFIQSDFTFVDHPSRPDLTTPGTGMKSMVDKILIQNTISYDTKVNKIKNKGNEFLVECENSQYLTPRIYCTAPLPQTLSLLDDGETLKAWENFTRPYSDYRKTLVFTAFWNEEKKDRVSFREISRLDPGADIEYYTVESEKASKNPFTILSIQFSEKFSDKHFEDWIGEGKQPGNLSRELGKDALRKIFEDNQLAYCEPDDFRIHRWKFAAPKKSLFDKDETMNFDLQSLQEYVSLCRETSFIPVGDWLFGQRVTKCILGSLVLPILLGESPEWVGEILT